MGMKELSFVGLYRRLAGLIRRRGAHG
jgi:hypothetical protein